jgi:predicted lipid-binding transport protein (Tim44 family)
MKTLIKSSVAASLIFAVALTGCGKCDQNILTNKARRLKQKPSSSVPAAAAATAATAAAIPAAAAAAVATAPASAGKAQVLDYNGQKFCAGLHDR